MVIVKLDISNAFGSLCARVVLDVLSDNVSRDYECVIKVDEEFETDVHEQTILCHYSYDGTTNYVKCKTGGL